MANRNPFLNALNREDGNDDSSVKTSGNPFLSALETNRKRRKKEEEDDQLQKTVESSLDKGKSFEDIATETGIGLDSIRQYVDVARPGYGVKSQPKGNGKGLLEQGGDFGQGIIDWVGGGIARGVIRLGGLVSEPLPGEQRKAAEDFIKKYAENTPSTSDNPNPFFYDETSGGGKLGRKIGTPISAGVQIAGIGKAGTLARGFSGAKLPSTFAGRAGTFTAGSLAETGAVSGITVGQGNKIDLPREAGVGLLVDLGLRGGGKLLKGVSEQVSKSPLSRDSRVTRHLSTLEQKIAGTQDPKELAKLTAQRRNYVAKQAEKSNLSVSERFNNAIVDRMFTTRKRIRQAMGDKITSQNYLDKLELATGNVKRSSIMADAYMRQNGFEEVMQQVGTKAREEQFAEYLLAKQRQFRRAQSAERGTKLSKGFMAGADQDKRTIVELASEYEDLAQKLHGYSQNYLRLIARPGDELANVGMKGLISEDLAESLIKENPEYIPLNKVLEQIESGTLGTANLGSLSKQNVVQKFKGAAGVEQNPLEAIYEKTHTGFNEMAKNGTARLLKDLKNVDGNPFGIKTLKEGEATRKSTISLLENGKKEILEVPDYIEKAFKGLNAQQGNALIRGLFLINRFRKLGFTGASPGFAARNLPRDVQFKAVSSRQGLKTLDPRDVVGGFVDTIKSTSTKQQAERLGAFGNLVDTFRGGTRRNLDTVRASKNAKSKIAHKITHPRELFRTLEDAVSVTETGSRAAAFRTTYRNVLKATKNKEEALAQATLAARRDSVDFFTMGEWGDLLKGWGLYLNPSIQGIRRSGQALKEQPVKTTLRYATVMMGPAMATTHWNLSDPKRKAAYDDIPDWEKDSNFIIVGPNPKYNEDTGRWEGVYKIPKVPGLREIANSAEELVRTAHNSGVDAGDFIRELGYGAVRTVNPESTFAGAITPDPVEPFIQQAANKNFFTGKQIVPDDKDFREAKEQYSSPTAKRISEMLSRMGQDVSPLRVDALLKDFTGSAGQGAQNILETGVGADKPGGRSYLSQITGSFLTAQGGTQKEILQNSFSNAIESKTDTSARITEALKLGDRKTADQLAKEYNLKLREIELLASKGKDSRKLSEKQKKLLETLRFPVSGGGLSETSVRSRLKGDD